MDYHELFALLPKTHCTWTSHDTQAWLAFIGLEKLSTKFGKTSLMIDNFAIDGSNLSMLTT